MSRVSCLQHSQQAFRNLLGKFHFQGFIFAASYWGSPTLREAFGKLACIASSYTATSWEIIGIAFLFAAIHWGIRFLLFQAIGEFPFSGLLLHRSSSEIPNCLRFVRSYSRISIAKCCFASSNSACEAILVNGAMFLKASLHGVKRKQGGGGWSQPPHLHTRRLYHGF